MDYSNFCINCFHETGGEQVCMHCGYVQTDRPKSISHLFPHTVLYDRYLIGRVINNGGFGVVYKAYDMRLETVVAIKELLPTQNSMVTRMAPAQDVIPVNDERAQQFAQLKQRFMEEARTVAQFSSCESVVQIYDFFEANNTAYLVMEFLDGETLRERLNRNSERMSYDDAMNIMMPIMQAVKVVHEKNVVHKDISPDNIFICNDGRVKLIDFGASKFGDNDKGNDFMSIVAKPGYTPPEQYQTNGNIGPFSDIYAIGAVIYTVVTGQLPDESVDRINKDELKRPSKLGAQLPVQAEKSIMKAMALKEDARFKNMSDFIDAINGKKHADFPEVEIKKRKIRRTIAVVMSFVLMISAVAITYVVKISNNIIPRESATITAWYCDDGDEEMNKRWDKLEKDFNDFAKGQDGADLSNTKIEFVAVKRDEYDQKLQEAIDNGTAPDIYQVTDSSQSENATSLKFLYSEIDKENKKDDLFADGSAYYDMKDALKSNNAIAVTYDVPVIYSYTDNTDNKAPEASDTIQDLTKKKNKKVDTKKDPNAKPDPFDVALVTNPAAILYATYGLGNDYNTFCDDTKLLYESSRLYEKADGKQSYYAPSKKFTNSDNNARHYIGFISECSDIAKKIRLGHSSFVVSPLVGKNSRNVVMLPEIWSVNSKSSQVKKQTAKLFLYFALCTVDGQNDFYRVNNNTYYLPMLKKSSDGIQYENFTNVINSVNDTSVDNVCIPFEDIKAVSDKTNQLSQSAQTASDTVDNAKEIVGE